MKKIKIFSGLILLSLLIPSLSLVKAQTDTGGREMRVENREQRINQMVERASTIEGRLENRENNIERIRERIASSTASTSARRMENLDKRFEKQLEQMGKIKDRLLNKELKVTEVLGKIASKIQERINILTTKGLDLTTAKNKLTEAVLKIEEITTEGANLAILIETEITEENKDILFSDAKKIQDNIKLLAKEVHALLVDTIKEITEVLPAKPMSTTTATSAN